MKWEYCTESIRMRSEKSVQELLELRGNEGWELVTVHKGLLYFKQPKVEEVKRPFKAAGIIELKDIFA